MELKVLTILGCFMMKREKKTHLHFWAHARSRVDINCVLNPLNQSNCGIWFSILFGRQSPEK
jgi:hypothetical protein